ncbi:IMPACT family protein [Bifidobacterium choloepi]|uniref:YigZ family protein n=1 Tax=Bifidobacterium choloepi TaxID=2614131 RepID=A0A6I5MYH9_9BIFI|nr:YigZ family protein [Bifidobacterium choloepi]NEG69668.1 YigZ family protein [Bifidobacterium choloepi]
MRTVTNTADEPAHDGFVEKKSEFIGDAAHVGDMDEALLFVESVRERHPKSRHVAFAALVTDADGRVIERMSDDGEPSGTAGKPILDVLRANDLTDTVVTVTRYFGGILLGSGGLIRAYSTGASLAVKAADVVDIVPCRRFSVTLQYPQLGSFQNLLATLGGRQDSADFTDVVMFHGLVRDEDYATLQARTTDLFNGQVALEALDLVNEGVGRE